MDITDRNIKAAYDASKRQELYLKVADAKAATRVLTRKFNNQNVPTVAQVSYVDGRLIIVDATGRTYTGTQADIDDYLDSRQNTLAVYAESERKLTYWRSYAVQQGVPQDQIDAITSPTILENSRFVEDLNNIANDFFNRNGFLPWNDPPVVVQQPEPQIVNIGPGLVNENNGNVSPAVASTPLTPQENRVLEALGKPIQTAGGLIGISGPAAGGGALVVTGTTMATLGKESTSPTGFITDTATPTVDENITRNRITFNDQAEDRTTSDATALKGAAAKRSEGYRNPLEQFESYTYNISLYLITDSEYKLMTQNHKSFNPSNLLIGGAGRGPRAAEWQDDFYFEDLQIRTISGLNNQSRGSNMVEMNMKIIEPYGLSFIDRLIKTTSRIANKNYAANCYLLQIDFFDSMKGLISSQTKRLPFRIIGLNAKVSTKGSEYKITGSPFVHHAMSQTVATTPVNMTVNAQTLRDFFRQENASSAQAGKQAAQDNREQLAEAFSRGVTGKGVAVQNFSNSNSGVYVINSYVASYNAWQKSLVDMKLKPTGGGTQISVKFHDAIIAGEKMINTSNEQEQPVGSSPMRDAGARESAAAPPAPLSSWTINAGTSIVEVINMAMMSSEYVRSQAVTTSADSGKQGATNWWKITPSVEIKNYDETNSVYDFNVTYFVMPYRLLNTTHPNLPRASVGKGDALKIYDYIYSGNNRSVIDFNLEFNYLYFTKITAIGIDRSDQNAVRSEGASATPTQAERSQGVGSVPTHIVADDQTGAGKNARGDKIAMAIASAADGIYSNAVAEMIKAQLKIIGDPMWIKQDEIYVDVKSYYDPKNANAKSDGVSSKWPNLASGDEDGSNGSLPTDIGDMIVWVEVKVPVDINDATGQLRKGENTTSVFTGAYKALEVNSNFSKGIFTQTLELIRYLNQPIDKDNVSTTQRQASADPNGRLLNDQNLVAQAEQGNYGIVTYSVQVQPEENA